MIVYTYYDSDPDSPKEQARFIRLWAESWRKYGWKPLLLTERMAEEHPKYQPRCSNMAKAVFATKHFDEPGFLVPPNMINFGLRPKRIASGGTNFYIFCLAISRETIRQASVRLKYRSGISPLCTSDPTRVNVSPLVRFRKWNADEVLNLQKYVGRSDAA